MKERVVGISEFAVSSDSEESLITHSLGSCIGLVLHDPVAGVGGMLHSFMPSSRSDPGTAAANPARFTDTGASLLLQEMFDRGATRANLVAKVVGAASRIPDDQLFRIGERNHAVVRRVLWKNGVLIAAESVGGCESRTVRLQVGTGRVHVKSNSVWHEL